MLFWIELVQHRADDRCAKRLQLLFCSAHFIAIGASGADDQKDPIDEAAEQERVVHRKDWRRIQEHDPITL